MSKSRRSALHLLFAAIVLAVYGVATQQLKSMPRQTVNVEMQVALPLFVQVAMSGGDRFLAANIGTVRALWVDNFKMTPDAFKTLAKVQEDVAWLNPGQEENYYLAAAILSWSGQVAAAQRILAKATHARPFDPQPSFFYAFNQVHFLGDRVGATLWMQQAAERMADADTRLIMQNFAARWVDKIDDLDLAIRIVESLSAQATRRDFKRYMDTRVRRLKVLKTLRDAANLYQQREAKALASLDDLVRSGIISEIPRDPFGFGYEIDSKGAIVLRTSPPAKQNK